MTLWDQNVTLFWISRQWLCISKAYRSMTFSLEPGTNINPELMQSKHEGGQGFYTEKKSPLNGIKRYYNVSTLIDNFVYKNNIHEPGGLKTAY